MEEQTLPKLNLADGRGGFSRTLEAPMPQGAFSQTGLGPQVVLLATLQEKEPGSQAGAHLLLRPSGGGPGRPGVCNGTCPLPRFWKTPSCTLSIPSSAQPAPGVPPQGPPCGTKATSGLKVEPVVCTSQRRRGCLSTWTEEPSRAGLHGPGQATHSLRGTGWIFLFFFQLPKRSWTKRRFVSL